MSDLYHNRSTAPARLHRILVTLQQLAADGRSVLQAWSAAGHGPRQDAASGFRMLAETTALIADARREIESLGAIKSRLVLEHWEKLESFVVISQLGAPMRDHLPLLAEPLPTLLLKAHEDLLDTAPRVFPEGAVDRLRARFERLHRDILRANDLPPELRRVLADIVAAALHALVDYDTRGVPGLEQALQYGVGVYMQHRDLIDVHATHPLVMRTAASEQRLGGFAAWASANSTKLQIGAAITQTLLSAMQVYYAIKAGTPIVLPVAVPLDALGSGTPV